nr:hypothetical protein [Tanacetum cinerariifolium]
MVAKHDQKILAEKEGTKKTASAKQPKPMPAILKSTKPAPAPKPKATNERLSKASTAKPPKPKLAKEKSTKTTLPQKAGKGEGNKDDMELAIQMSLELFQAQSQEHVGGMAIREPVAEATQPLPIIKGKAIEASSTRSSTQAQDDTSANTFRDSPYTADAKTGVASEKTNSRCDTEILEIDEKQGKDVNEQARPDPRESHGALVGPDPEPTHDKYMTDLYPKVQESLKFSVDEDVILEDPIRSTGTLSFIKNMEDAYAVGDQFLNDKSTEDEPKKPNIEAKVVSMVTVPIYQASFSVPSLSTPIPKNKTLDNTSQNLRSRVFHLELRDLPHMIDEAVRESVREAVHMALQAPLRDRFRELSEADMKEILHQRMFETGTYKSLLEHVALYEALEASIERANRDELLTEMDNSSKQQSGPHTEQPVEDLPMPETANISDLEKTDSAHLLKIKQRPEWLKPILDDLNLTKPGWDAKGFEYKHDCTIIDSPRTVVFPVGNNERKIMRFNEIYKFSDGMLMKIMEALDFRVKEYKPEPEGSTRDNPLVSIEVLRYDIKRSKCENKGIVPTEMELELEQTQQGSSHEVSISTEGVEE